MDARVVRWGRQKTAGFRYPSGPTQSNFGEYARNSTVSGFMQSHVPAEYAKEQVIAAPNVSFEDRVRLLGAVQSAASTREVPDNLVQMRNFLPALVGAGIGVVGAALTAPIFGMTPLQKKIYGVGAGALGAVLNTYGRD